jgi:hypothetical protein
MLKRSNLSGENESCCVISNTALQFLAAIYRLSYVNDMWPFNVTLLNTMQAIQMESRNEYRE